MMRLSVDRPRHLPVTFVFLSVVAAVGMQLLQPQLWPVWTYALIGLAGTLSILFWLLWRWPSWVLLTGVAALVFGCTGWRASHYASSILPADLQGRDIVVQGQVTDLPQWLPDSVRFAFAVNSATLDGKPVALPNTLSLAWYLPRNDRDVGSQAAPANGHSPTDAVAPENDQAESNPEADRCALCVKPGERWRLVVRLKQPHGSRNPHGFDYELWLWEQGLGATGYVRANDGKTPPEKTGLAHPLDVRAWRDQARLQAREAVYRTLLPQQANVMQKAGRVVLANTDTEANATPAERAAGIVAALLMGDQRAITQPDWDIFRITGVSHLLSISGLHITLFAWLAGGLAGALWRQSARLRRPALCLWLATPLAAMWCGMALATAYAWFSGWGVPAQRTCTMLLTVALLRTWGMTWPWQATLATAAATVLLIDPWALLQPGFWLSFVAVGVLFATVPPARAASQWPQKLKQAIAGFLRAQLAIMLVLTPLSLLLFGRVSVIGFLANVLAVPLITFVVTPLVLLGTAWPASWHLASALLQMLMALLQQLAAIPWASYQVAIAPWWAGAAGIAGGMLLMLRLPWPWRLAGALSLLPALLWQAPRPAQGHFDLLAADVGQGSAVLVRTRTHSLLFDAGPQYSARSNAGERIVLPLLGALNEQPGWLLLSHQDNDHAGGAASLLQAHPQMQVLGSVETSHPLQQMRAIMPCTAEQTWQWDGVNFTVLHPPESGPASPSAQTNAMSCVLHVSNGQRSALLAGDTETAQERVIVDRQQATPGALQADLLVVGHHGSKTSTSAAWLTAVQPRWAVIQQGYRNRYHHPHPKVLQRLHEHGVAIRLSESCGAAWWRSDDGSLQCEREQNRRYWQHQPDLLQQTAVPDQR